MSIFNKYSKLHGLPLPGQKITFKAPAAWGYFTNVIEDEKNLLVPGQEQSNFGVWEGTVTFTEHQ